MPQSKENLLCNLAHELRQPLSTIESIAYYLELALPNADPRVLEQLTRLRHLVAQSGWMISDSLALSQEPDSRPEAIDLDELLSEFVLEQMQHDARRVRPIRVRAALRNQADRPARRLAAVTDP